MRPLSLAAALLAAAALAAGAPSLSLCAPLFEDVTEESGIAPLRHGEGVVAVDLTGDGLPDLFLPCVRGPGRLYRNIGGLRFTDVTGESGTGESGGVGAVAGRFGEEGGPGVLVARGADPYAAPNVLYLKLGAAFSDESVRTGVGAVTGGLTATAADFDLDGELEVFLPGWGLDRYLKKGADGVYREAGRAAGIVPGGRGWAATVSDFDGDTLPDLFVSHGSGQGEDANRLYLNTGRGSFTEAAAGWGVADAPWSMGPVSGDLDGDGDADLFVPGWAGPGHLYRNDGERFTDVTAGCGVKFPKAVGASLGMADGDLLPDLALAGFPGPVKFFRNLGGMRFEEVALSGLGGAAKNEGLTLADLDGDGDLDLYVTNLKGENALYRNTLDDPRYLRVRFRPGRGQVVGALARLYEGGKLLAAQELKSAAGMGQGPEEVLFRLTGEGPFDLTVTFPGGAKIEKTGVSRGDILLER